MGELENAENEKLLSIGALSKQRGGHTKSLRYYDRLGILCPAHVDPDTRCRYYSLHQIPVADAIQLCVELDTPLKYFTEYYTETGHQLHYAKLVEHGTALAREKIQTIQKCLAGLDAIQAEISRSGLVVQSAEGLRCCFPALDIWLTPCPNGLAGRNDPVHFRLCRKEQRKLFSYFSVEIPEEKQNIPSNILHIPAGEYLCRRADGRSILDAAETFPEQFAMDGDKPVLISELFSGEYDYTAPYYELRCSLPNQAGCQSCIFWNQYPKSGTSCK